MVTMWQSFINYWKGYVNFTGRSTRAEFWWMRLWSIIAFVVWLVLFIIALVTDANVVNKLDSIEGKFDTDSAWSFVGALFSAPFTIIVVMIAIDSSRNDFAKHRTDYSSLSRRWYCHLGSLGCLVPIFVYR